MGKRKTVKRKVVTGKDGQPVVTEEVTEKNIPQDFGVTVTDEQESVIEDVVQPVITEVKEDTTTHTEFIVEEVADEKEGPVDEIDTDKIKDKATRQRKKKKVMKKRKIIKNKVVTDEDGQTVVTHEVTEADLPKGFEVTITDEKESVIEGVVKPVIT